MTATKKVILGIVGVAVLCLLIGVLTIYLMASWAPADYAPLELTKNQQKTAAVEFVNHVLNFGNGDPAHPAAAYTWSITERQLNRYLASLEEIAALGDRGEVARKALDQARLMQPAVALHPGTITLMARSTDYGKVISVTLGLSIRDEGKTLHVSLEKARIGRVSVPDGTVRDQMAKLRESFAEAAQRNEAASDNATTAAMAAAATVLSATDSSGVPTELKWFIGKRRLRIEAIDIDEGRITVRIVPVVDQLDTQTSRQPSSARTRS